MTDPAAGNGERMPIPMGVVGETGATHPRLTDDNLRHISGDSGPVLARSARSRALAVDGSVDDPMDLTQTGWAARDGLFALDNRLFQRMTPDFRASGLLHARQAANMIGMGVRYEDALHVA